MKTAYIVKAYRTAVGKAPRGLFRFKRPDELAAETIQHMMKELPQLDKSRIDDVIVGNAMPEAEQGLNMARLISLMGLKIEDVPGVTVNRNCASGAVGYSVKSRWYSSSPWRHVNCSASARDVMLYDGPLISCAIALTQFV